MSLLLLLLLMMMIIIIINQRRFAPTYLRNIHYDSMFTNLTSIFPSFLCTSHIYQCLRLTYGISFLRVGVRFSVAPCELGLGCVS